MPRDYERLKEFGISVAPKICIARYGGSYRGVKAKVARDNRAHRLILYSDPAHNPYMRLHLYPRGPWRSAHAIQRRTVKYIFQHARDPLTPGWAATQEADRLTIAEATDLPQIPVVPQTTIVPPCQTVATSPRLPERAIGVAGRLAVRLSRRTRAGEGSPQGAMRAQHPAHLQRHLS